MFHFRANHFAAKHFAMAHLRGLVGGGIDTHDGASEYWLKYWRKLHEKKKKEPTLEDVIEAVQANPQKAIAAVPEVRKEFKEVNYSGLANNLVMAEFVAKQLLIQYEIRRIEEMEEEAAIEFLLLH